MLLNLLVLNVFIMLCSWLLVTYNQQCRTGGCGLEFQYCTQCHYRGLGHGNCTAAGPLISGRGEWHLVLTPDLASAAPLCQ